MLQTSGAERFERDTRCRMVARLVCSGAVMSQTILPIRASSFCKVWWLLRVCGGMRQQTLEVGSVGEEKRKKWQQAKCGFGGLAFGKCRTTLCVALQVNVGQSKSLAFTNP